MNFNRIKFLPFAIILIFSCTSKGKTEEHSANEIATTLVGRWQTSEIFMNYTSYRNDPEKDSVLLLNQFTYTDLMGATPQVITFSSDGNYSGESIRMSTGDTVKSVGTWQTDQNKLIIDFGIVRNEYEVIYLKQDSIAMKGVIDLDGDKEVDDQVEFKIIRR